MKKIKEKEQVIRNLKDLLNDKKGFLKSMEFQLGISEGQERKKYHAAIKRTKNKILDLEKSIQEI